MVNKMKIALAQMDVIPNKPKKNVEKMLSYIKEAKSQNVDLIVFPELCVGGYLLGDKWLEESYVDNLMSYNQTLKEASKGIAIAYGNIYVDKKKNHPNKDGRVRKYNAVYIYQNGEEVQRSKASSILPQGVQPKTLLPNYRFFDDERYFFSTQDIAKDYDVSLSSLLEPFEIVVNNEKIPIGFEVCEDLWYEDYKANKQPINVTKHLLDNGAKYIVNLSASPWTHKKNQARDKRISYLKKAVGDDFVPFFYVNNVGVQNNGKNFITFDGGTTVYNKEGEPVIFDTQSFEEELIVLEHKDWNVSGSNRPEESSIKEKYEAIIRGIQHIKDIFGSEEQPRYVIGLSGGIDSSVVAALLVKAVGPKKVIGINMPTKYNSDKTKDSAYKLAKELGIYYDVVEIQSIVDLNTQLINNSDADGTGRKVTLLNEENIQAKLRGTSILSNLAAKYGGIFTNNGNKVETALGYATLYGDVGGAFSPIADLTKEEVYALATYLNEEVYDREVIPKTLIPDELFRFGEDQIQPSAELQNDQVDPIKIGYHCKLLTAMTDYKKVSAEQILESYLNGTMEQDYGISDALMKRWGMDDPVEFIKDLEWFEKGIQRNVFKRIQSPPIILTSKSAYGYDIRESMLPYDMTKKYEELKKKVLEMK